MGSKFFINYLRQKWCQINDLYVAVALYWVCRYRLPSAVVDYVYYYYYYIRPENGAGLYLQP